MLNNRSLTLFKQKSIVVQEKTFFVIYLEIKKLFCIFAA